LLWHPYCAPVRKTEPFKTFVRKSGSGEYWKANSLTDLRDPTTGDDIVCE
jgi:hypothetical protein